MASSGSSIGLFVLPSVASAGIQVDLQKVLADVRSSDYIAEASSSECSPEDSGLWDLVTPSTLSQSSLKADDDDDAAVQSIVRSLSADSLTADGTSKQLSRSGFIVADARTFTGDGSLLVVQIDAQKHEEVCRLRTARGSLVEVVSVDS